MMSHIELAKASNDGSMTLENCDVMDQLYSSPMHRGDSDQGRHERKHDEEIREDDSSSPTEEERKQAPLASSFKDTPHDSMDSFYANFQIQVAAEIEETKLPKIKRAKTVKSTKIEEKQVIDTSHETPVETSPISPSPAMPTNFS
jgi:hypothetical protein